jgi:hypothetical protein
MMKLKLVTMLAAAIASSMSMAAPPLAQPDDAKGFPLEEVSTVLYEDGASESVYVFADDDLVTVTRTTTVVEVPAMVEGEGEKPSFAKRVSDKWHEFVVFFSDEWEKRKQAARDADEAEALEEELNAAEAAKMEADELAAPIDMIVVMDTEADEPVYKSAE